MTAQAQTETGLRTAWLEALELWKGSRRSANTQRAYLAGLQDLLTVSGKRLEEIGPGDTASWVEGMRRRGLAESTVQLRLSGCASFYRYAVEECGLALEGKAPTSGRSLRRRVTPYGKARWLGAEEARSLLGAIERKTLRGKRDYALVLGYLLMGRRNSEWRAARRSDFETRGATVKFCWSGKGKTDQLQETPAPVWKAVVELIQAGQVGKSGYLFTDVRSGRAGSRALSAREVRRVVKKYARAAGLDPAKVHVHTLRHSAAMLRKESGAGLEEVMAFLVHSSLAVTQIYVHSLEGRQDESWGKVAQLLGV